MAKKPRKPRRQVKKVELTEAEALLQRQKAEQANTEAFVNGYGALCRRHGLMFVPVPTGQLQGTIMIVSGQLSVVPLPPGQDVNLRLAGGQPARQPAFAPTPQPGPDLTPPELELPLSEDVEPDPAQEPEPESESEPED